MTQSQRYVLDWIEREAMIREVLIHLFTITTKRAKKTWPKRKYIEILQINLRRPGRAYGCSFQENLNSYLADQRRTVLRCIWECSSQRLVRRATKRPLRPKIGIARRTQNIPNPCIVTPVCTRLLPHSYFTSYIVNDVSSRPIALCGRQCKSARNSGKRFLGNAKWR